MPSKFPRLCLLPLALAGCWLRAADDLPKHLPGEAPDTEPKLMIDDLPDLTLSAPDAAEITDAAAQVSVERAKTELDRARSKQQRWQKLAKAGVLSQVEAESTAIQVARAVVKYQGAIAAQAAARVTELQARRAKGEIPAEELAAAENMQRTSAALAADAAVQFQRQLRLAAEAHLDRQRRLFTLGVVPKSQVRRAEEKLAALPAR